MVMLSEDFDIISARLAADALKQVLAARTHKKKVWGQVIVRPGQLGDALRLPTITSELNSKVAVRRERGLENFQALWDTLSEHTRQAVLHSIGWYDPKNLSWDDKRSNRRPVNSNETPEGAGNNDAG
ncbi:hypothetical protein EUZ85_25760 [Hahella sp. KA22]|nr:hypothetical protein ENC22_23175 [Hahella sp. KA22]QAY58490.1 hypothetical protein EUZ85_25760 [Hahella sp. KA22]